MSLLQDLLRSLRKAPRLYPFCNPQGVMLARAPYRDPDKLVLLWQSDILYAGHRADPMIALRHV